MVLVVVALAVVDREAAATVLVVVAPAAVDRAAQAMVKVEMGPAAGVQDFMQAVEATL